MSSFDLARSHHVSWSCGVRIVLVHPSGAEAARADAVEVPALGVAVLYSQAVWV